MALKPEVLRGWPPGGWSFFQPETDWHAPFPLQNNFEQQTLNIVAMRTANPAKNLPTDKAACAAELEAYTEARLSKVYSKNGVKKFMVPSPEDLELKKKASNGTPVCRSALGGVAALAGIETAALEDWLGDGGKPVSSEVANARAPICVTCPANRKGGWRELLTVPAAKALRTYLSIKHKLDLKTPLDAELGSCEACKCVLELKVWQPDEYIAENTSDETLEKHRKANPECWVLENL